jgi:hypothetical protein
MFSSSLQALFPDLTGSLIRGKPKDFPAAKKALPRPGNYGANIVLYI